MRLAYIVGGPPARVYDAQEITVKYRTIAAGKLEITWQYFSAAVENDYEEIFARLAAEHFDAVYAKQPTQRAKPNAHLSARVAPSNPSSKGVCWLGKVRVLLTYGQNSTCAVAQAMNYLDKILRGAKPGDLPVEQATNLELVVNLKTANTLGLTVPPSLIARADEVIE